MTKFYINGFQESENYWKSIFGTPTLEEAKKLNNGDIVEKGSNKFWIINTEEE